MAIIQAASFVLAARKHPRSGSLAPREKGEGRWSTGRRHHVSPRPETRAPLLALAFRRSTAAIFGSSGRAFGVFPLSVKLLRASPALRWSRSRALRRREKPPSAGSRQGAPSGARAVPQG